MDRGYGDDHGRDDRRDRGGHAWTVNVGLSVGMRRPTIHRTQNSIAPSKTTCVRPCCRWV